MSEDPVWMISPVDLGGQRLCKKMRRSDLQKLQELYVVFQSSSGCEWAEFWLTKVGSGASINKIADSFLSKQASRSPT